MNQNYDIIIVGGACAGLSAALYSARRALKTLVITKDIGGQIAITTDVENYPGVGTIMGPDLAEKFKQQAVHAGADIQFGEVTGVKKEGDNFLVSSSLGEFQAPVVVLAFGLSHRHLNVPGEEQFKGRGVTYCATCDGPLFKNKVVGVVGAGNSALDAAEYLSSIVSKVYLLVRSEIKAEQVLIDIVKARPNIEIVQPVDVKEIVGTSVVTGVVVTDSQTNETKTIDLNGLFVEIGWVTKTDFLKGMVELTERGFIKVDNQNRTSLPGLYAAGDVTDTPFKQAVISAGEGAKAAISAAQYIQTLRGVQAAAAPDWNKKK